MLPQDFKTRVRAKMACTLATAGLLCFHTLAVTQPLTNQLPSSVHVITNYYIFGGTNFYQMRASMVEARPWKRAMVFDAHTQWDVHATYRYARTQNGYKLGSIDVTTTAVITLPRWIPGKPVPWDLVTNWSRCFFGLSLHEQGHTQVAAAAGAEVRRRLEALDTFPSAQELLSAAEQALNDTVEEFRQRDKKYDEVTGHGRTQGAIFYEVVREDQRGTGADPSTNGAYRPWRQPYR